MVLTRKLGHSGSYFLKINKVTAIGGCGLFWAYQYFWYCMHNVVKIPLIQAIYEVYIKLCRLNGTKTTLNLDTVLLLGQTWYWISENKNLFQTCRLKQVLIQ